MSDASPRRAAGGDATTDRAAKPLNEAQIAARLLAAEMLNTVQRELKRVGDMDAANIVCDAWCELSLLSVNGTEDMQEATRQ